MMINKERLFREFKTLVEIDAESYEERAMADYLTERLRDLGLLVSEDDAGKRLAETKGIELSKAAGNIYGRLPGNCPGEALLFSSHMDTVNPGKSKRAVFHEDGTITSEGNTVLGADDAAGIASILEALTVIEEKHLKHPEIEVLFPVAEEAYGQGSRLVDYENIHAKYAYVLDLSGDVGTAAIAAPTILSVRITVHGKSAHAGFAPEEGVHAILIAAKAIAQIPNGHVDGETTVNLGQITGGNADNIVPNLCTVTGEVRSMTHEKALAQADKIRAAFEEEAKKAGGSVEVKIEEEVRAYRISKENEVVERFVKACAQNGLKDNLIETFGGSDNNHFVKNGMEGIVVACAMSNVHTKQEFTTESELAKSGELALTLMINV